ncbi:MAG: YdcF family protein [Flavobacteriaceae bacterium]|nr:YdcF family protein [Flavobacteriaceae bacterium]
MDKTTELLVVLGAPNSVSGELSTISISRLKYCLQHFNKQKRILCTGGFGTHFNTTKIPHATYAKEYLLEHGISTASFLASALSSNTVEDAVKTKSIISKLDNIKLLIISSDYHIKRVEYIFNKILKEYSKTYIGVASNLDAKTLAVLNQHEKESLESMVKKGLYY